LAKKNNKKMKEIRSYNTTLEIEEREGKTSVIRGHAAVFDSLSENLGGFREKIAHGAFDTVIEDDVRALFNHDSNMILGRTKSGTLKLGIDERGLTYEIDPPNTSYANDLRESMKRGDISQSSFGFVIDEDDWREDDDGVVIRTIKKVKRLYDVSPVTYPAYEATDSTARSLEKFIDSKPKSKVSESLIRRQEQELFLLGKSSESNIKIN